MAYRKCSALLACFAAATISCFAGATIPINDTAYIDLGLRVQMEYVATEKDLDGDGSWDRSDDFKLRRARLRLKAVANEQLGAFLQTESSTGEGVGLDMRVIDAYAYFQPAPLWNLYFGQHLVPSSRQGLTSAGALMTIDRSPSAYKSLTWGARAKTAFTNTNLGDTDSGLRGDVDVRDTGITLFGNQALSEALHLKYYLGTYNGIQKAADDNPRLTGRAQINFGDPESSYFYKATYLGKIKTLALGLSYDMQDRVMDDVNGEALDYRFLSLDLFSEFPAGPGSISCELGYQVLDLDAAAAVDVDGDTETAAKDWRRSQGDGLYMQAGYLLGDWQPWLGWERWESDAEDKVGSCDHFRLGITYFIDGHHANIKAGVEHLEAETKIGLTEEDTLDSFVLSVHLSY